MTTDVCYDTQSYKVDIILQLLKGKMKYYANLMNMLRIYNHNFHNGSVKEEIGQQSMNCMCICSFKMLKRQSNLLKFFLKGKNSCFYVFCVVSISTSLFLS